MRDFEPVGIVSLGCPKNIVDSERILGKLLQSRYYITFDESEAHSIIINTCAFLKSARDEAESVILEFIDRKRKGLIKKIVVSGCYPSLVKEVLLKKFPDIDAITGTNDLSKIVDALEGKKRLFVSKEFEYEPIPRLQITLPHYEYLKIADGCNHSCAFCLIPSIKGTVHSFSIDKLFEEAENLTKNGVKELILIAQDTTQYGVDLYGKNSLLPLLQKLETVNGLEWIRILYTYPSEITDELVDYIASSDKVVPYIDVPIQHINNKILKRMGRVHDRLQTERIIRTLKDKYIAIRTTVITGFPGESEEEFKELRDFIKDIQFEHLGVFAFSREEGTKSYSMKLQVNNSVKLRRKEEIEEIQFEINKQKLANMVGQSIPIIVDYYDEGSKKFIGRTQFDAPEIDDYVVVSNNVEEGKIYRAKITGADSEKLFAEVER